MKFYESTKPRLFMLIIDPVTFCLSKIKSQFSNTGDKKIRNLLFCRIFIW